MNKTSRRAFITQTGITAAGISIMPKLIPVAHVDKTKYTGKKLNVALVGLGRYAAILADGLQASAYCKLAGVVTGHPEKGEAWKKQYNLADKNIYNYSNFDSIDHNPDIDVVYIVLPPSIHKEYTIRAAKAGKHVICEKPMAISVQECEEMIAACKKAKKMLSIGYRLHFEPHNQEMMRLGQQQVYGKLQHIDTFNGFKYNGDPKAWRLNKALGGGPLMDMG